MPLQKTKNKGNIVIMEFTPKRKILLLSLAACIAFSVVFTVDLTAASHDHICSGDDCPVCLYIEMAHIFLKTIRLAVIGLFLALCLAFSVQNHKKYAGYAAYLLSPVTLKVRFNS
jgi:hypothetical protein